jgi:hypothetical protein
MAPETTDRIEQILIEEDIEGLIAAGAPQDEYRDEALQISQALSQFSLHEHTSEHVLAAITLLWAKCFGLTPGEMRLRVESLKKLAQKIVA